MRNIAKAAIVSTVAAIAIATGGQAQAATIVPDSYHSGTAGCFSWSWSDGIISTTVYYHNTCGSTHVLGVYWGGSTATCYTVGANVKSNFTVYDSTPSKFQ
jgi:hypothetical protein